MGAPLDTMTLLHHAEHLTRIPDKRVARYEVAFAWPGGGMDWRMVEEFDTSRTVVAGLDDDYLATIVTRASRSCRSLDVVSLPASDVVDDRVGLSQVLRIVVCMSSMISTGPVRRRRRRSVTRDRASYAVRAGGAAPGAGSGTPRDSLSSKVTAAGDRTTVRPGLAEALAGVDAALDVLAGVDLDGEDGRAVLGGVVRQQRLANRLAALQLDLVGRADQSCAYLDDGAATLAAWLRARTRLDAGVCSRQVVAAGRLWRFPALAAAARAGEVTAAHVTAVTGSAVPRRADAVAAHDDVLTVLSCHAPPRDVRVALARIADHADRDGVDQPAEPFGADRRDPRCELWVRPGIDGLGDMQATLSQLDTEGLLTLLDALETPDPPDTPEQLRRSPAQRRGDAFSELIRRALANGLAPTVHGVKPQVLLAIDLAALLPAAQRADLDLGDVLARAGITDDMLHAAGVDPGTLRSPDPTDPAGPEDHMGPAAGPDGGPTEDETATGGGAIHDRPADVGGVGPVDSGVTRPRAKLRFTGDVDSATACRLLDEAAVRCVLTMGPWRTVAVGRTFRTLPPWLRPLLDLVHAHCRGPDCDRPIPWTQAHHQHAWVQLGETDVNQTIPLCVRHHDLVTTGQWDAQLDPDTGIVTWTSPHGTIHHTRPPP